MNPHRILGIDYGSKRIGIAVSDPSGRFGFPISVIQNSPVALAEIQKIARDQEAGEIVLGESKNYKGEANTIMADILDFKEQLEALGFKVILEPEFMTSANAERFQGKNELHDASAAALILQSFLDKRANTV